MPLPILQTTQNPLPEDLVRLFHRTELHWIRDLGEEALLEVGVAFTNPSMPGVWTANTILDAALPAGLTAAEAVSLVDQHYASQDLRCLQWIMNPSAPAAQTVPLVEYLTSQEWLVDRVDILYLRGPSAAPLREEGGLTIIPARASFRHARLLAEEFAEECKQPRGVEARLAHLDNPSWDAVIALKGDIVVGQIGVLAVGDVGRIDDVYITRAFRRQGIGITLMSRALEICARSLFRHVMLACNPANQPAQSLYARLAFQKIGEMISYRTPWVGSS
jgi:ribosomal protein S18 acetylase RimI-like enzyme